MRLDEILRHAEYIKSHGDVSVEIKDIVFDSRQADFGSLFVCIKGYKTDGHQYIAAAKEKGALAVVVTEEIDTLGLPTIFVADARRFMADAACALYDHPSRRLKVIGITGTNGKTTVAYLAKSILELADKKTGLIGTNEILYGDVRISAERTTPESAQIQYVLNEMCKSGIEYCVMEVSSHSLELHRVRGMQFEVGVFTNLTHDHLDFHGNMENYLKAKAQLFGMCKKAVINLDDAYGKEMLSRCPNIPIYTFGIDNLANIQATECKLSDKGVIYKANTPEGPLDIKVSIPGRFSIYNSLAAIGACMQLGLAGDDIVKGLRISKGAKGRAEMINTPAPYKVMIDYAHTPDGLFNILSTVREFASGKIITVFGSAGDRDKEKRQPMGKIAGRLSDLCVITADNPASEKAVDIIAQIEEGLAQSGCSYICIEDREEAIRYALGKAMPGDVVLLAGKGHETYQIVGDEKRPFSEKEIVKKYFENEG